MTPRFDPSGYPGPRPSGPVLVHGRDVHPLAVDGDVDRPVRLVPAAAGPARAPVLAPGSVRWSLAYGANASPHRLVDKGLDRRGALLLPARLLGWVPVFEARRTGYGAVPLTLVPAFGHQLSAWVLGVHVDDLDALDRSEGRAATSPGASGRDGDDVTTAPPGRYVLGRVGPVAVADRFVLPGALAYLPGPGTTLQRDAAGWRTWPEHDQRSATRGLSETGTAPAPRPERPVAGPWPATPLDDPPLFVYGTLRPGGRAFHLVADLVHVAGEARAPGRVNDTGRGYPAALLHDPDAAGDVHGFLLTPRDPVAARELVVLLDRYEGCPPYRRIAVRATTADGPRWALAYTWDLGEPPGRVVPDGRWRGPGT